MKELNRRKFLGLTLGAVTLAALEACSPTLPTPSAKPDKPSSVKPEETPVSSRVATAVAADRQDAAATQVARNATATGTPPPTATVNPEFARISAELSAQNAQINAQNTRIAEIKASMPAATATEVPFRNVSGVKVYGIPEKVSEDVDHVKSPFRNPSGVMTHILGDNGVYVAEADIVDRQANNPYGKNPEGADTVYKSGGSIRFMSPVNTEVFRWAGEAFQNLPEGGFIELWSGQMRIEIPRDSNATDPNKKTYAIDLPYKEGNVYAFIARGLFADGKQDTDRNRTVKVTKYKAGHALAFMYESRFETNAAFVSEESFMQRLANAHKAGTNCGAEGCSMVTLIGLDTNTGALEIIEQKLNQQEAQAASKDWKLARKNLKTVFTNWN